MLSADVTTADL